jgi:hypothetical protein
MHVDWSLIVYANLCVALGASIQATVGYGMNLIAMPLLLSIDRALVPGPLLLAHLLLVLALSTLDRRQIQRGPLGLATAAAVPGTLAGLAALSYLGHGAFVLFTALVLVAATVLIGRRVPLVASRRNLLLAGLVSGFCGTTTSINGPPLAAVMGGAYRLEQVRATLTSFLLISTCLSLAGLFAVGQFRLDSLLLSFSIAPGVLLGIVLARAGLRRVAARVNAQLLFFSVSGAATALFVGRELWRFA